MNRTSIRFILAALLFFALCSPALAQGGGVEDPAAVPGTVLDVRFVGRVDAATVQQQARPTFANYGVPIIENAVDVYVIQYATTDLDGSLTPITAQLFLPVLHAGAAPTALYAFGSGTTGVGEACAPSREAEYGRPLGQYREYMQAYAGRGFVSIIPDYLGFNDPDRPQAYFHAVAEGRVMLDAIRATYAFLETEAPDLPAPTHVFTAGYSQGGHAAFAAADLRPTYAPEVPLHGMIGFAPTTNVERLLREGPYYAPYIAVSYADTYGEEVFDPAAVLRDRWLPTLARDAEELCVDRAQAYYPFDENLMYAPEFRSALYGGSLGEAYPSIKSTLDANRTGLTGHGLPSLIVQGGQDIIVRDPTQELFVAELCEAGNETLYANYPEARHRHTKPAGFEDAIAWMKSIAGGGAAPTSCPLVTSPPG